jgi:16S rRNA (uracil1498-N3)-methyltransferase
MNVFFAFNKDGHYFLDEKETHHCLHVLRRKDNDKIYFINGKGELFEGIVEIVKNKTIKINNPILIKKNTPPLPYVHIAIAPTKQFQRMEWFLEKAIECGVNEISFIKTKRTERFHASQERCLYIVRNAMKQSLMLYEPKFNSGINFDSFVKDSVKIENSFKGICHQNEKTDFVGDLGMYSNYIFLIGPEGDFTDDEIQLAIENDFNEIHLGNNRLRTETAGLFSIISVRSRFK